MCSDVGQSGVQPVLQLLKMQLAPIKTRVCGRSLLHLAKFPTPPTPISPPFPTPKLCSAVGTACFFGRGSGISRQYPDIYELENLKPKQMVHLRWDPLQNAYMMVKVLENFMPFLDS